MSKYELIACDLDGTLLDGESKVGEENIAAIRELSRRGVYFVPSTGRAYSELPRELILTEAVRYVIYANGAAIIDRRTGERILFTITGDALDSVRRVIAPYDVHLAVRYMGATYVAREGNNPEAYRRYDICPEHEHVVTNYAEEVEDFESWFSSVTSVEVITVFCRDGETAESLRRELEKLGGIRTVSVAYNNIEILSERAGKGNALLALLAKLGIPKGRAIAVGDSGNDIPSFDAAGLALAVSNATEELKARADGVICSNKESVAEYILRKYF
ncbi:MAG: HAD family phosphatase [Clostridia bacterium]|nr:HAD family phosphatase [Clostridia bacterium]